ncbi:hypothetical protein IWW55_000312, partial [Coemansia sp. RSA 2706]
MMTQSKTDDTLLLFGSLPPPARADSPPSALSQEDRNARAPSGCGLTGTDEPVRTFVLIKRPKESSDNAENPAGSNIGIPGSAAAP